MPSSNYFNFWPFTQSEVGTPPQTIGTPAQTTATIGELYGGGGSGGNICAIGLSQQLQMAQAQQNAIHSMYSQQYQSSRTYPDSIMNLINEISTLCLNASAYIMKIGVDAHTYSRLINETDNRIRRSIDSDTLTINTAMGPIQIYCDDGKKLLGQVDWDKYMETVEEKI